MLVLLYPDMNNFLIKCYHRSNKTLIPFLLPSLLMDNESKTKRYFDLLNVCNFTFHSFISVSSVITDYHKKIPYVNQNIFRLLNLKCHGLIVSYFTYELYKVYQENKMEKK